MDVLTTALNAASVQAQFKNALGKHKDTFVASIIDLYSGDKQLQQCKPGAIIKEALRAATLKLPLNKALGFAYVVVYNNSVKSIDPATGRDVWQKVPTPTFIPGYKGYIQLAMRTGQYKIINADIVYEGELRRGNKLTGEILLDGEKTSDKVVGYFCHFELLNGFSKTLYMSVEDMAKYAKQYAPGIPAKTSVDELVAKANSGYASKQVGWMGNFNDMALKTVMRRLLSKYGYLSVEMMNATTYDIESEDAAASRNDIIKEKANAQVIDLDGDQYEEVAEIAEQQTAPAAEEESTDTEEIPY